MKNVWAVVIALLVNVGIGYAACMGPYCWDERGAYITSSVDLSGGLMLSSNTISGLEATTPTRTGQLYNCSDCLRATVCASSGTGRGAFVVAIASGTFAGGTYSGIQTCE